MKDSVLARSITVIHAEYPPTVAEVDQKPVHETETGLSLFLSYYFRRIRPFPGRLTRPFLIHSLRFSSITSPPKQAAEPNLELICFQSTPDYPRVAALGACKQGILRFASKSLLQNGSYGQSKHASLASTLGEWGRLAYSYSCYGRLSLAAKKERRKSFLALIVGGKVNLNQTGASGAANRAELGSVGESGALLSLGSRPSARPLKPEIRELQAWTTLPENDPYTIRMMEWRFEELSRRVARIGNNGLNFRQ
ncbi:protein kinase superfamily protein, partial [Striga asiatica]